MRDKIKLAIWMMFCALAAPLVVNAVDWYAASGRPAQRSALSSSDMRTEFAAIQSGIADKLPNLTGHGDELVRVNSGGTALESFADSGSLSASFSDACTTTPSVAFDYVLIGHMVVLQVSGNGGSCTADSANFQTAAGALPAALRPSYLVTSSAFTGFVDNGSGTNAVLRVYADGTIAFFPVSGTALTTWTASGTRQASQAVIAYAVP